MELESEIPLVMWSWEDREGDNKMHKRAGVSYFVVIPIKRSSSFGSCYGCFHNYFLAIGLVELSHQDHLPSGQNYPPIEP